MAGVKLFPLAILFFVLLGLAVKQISYHPLFSAPQHKQLFENLLYYYLPFAALLAVALKLWAEEVRNAKRALALQVVGNLGWMALSCCWMWQNDWVSLDRLFLLPYVFFAFVVFLATSSFFRCADDLGLWNFTAKLVMGFVVAVVASSIVCAGTNLLLWGIQSLFGFDFYLGVLYRCFYLQLFCSRSRGVLAVHP